MSNESARQEFSIDMNVGGLILKADENLTWSRFTFEPKRTPKRIVSVLYEARDG